MYLIDIAQENILISLAIVLGIGVLQGAILGRGIRKRFPSLKSHARLISIVLLILFTINSIANVIKFAAPDKMSVSDIEIPSNLEQVISLITNVMGIDAGFGTISLMFIAITLTLLFRFADLPSLARYFIFTLSFIMFCVALISRFTDYVPSNFEIMMYTAYQFGVTIGLFVIMRRKKTEENMYAEFDNSWR
jgi:uncharacterized membrane protein YfcA